MDINLSINPAEASTVIKDFIKTYVQSAGCKSVVIGLSGGVDSAAVAVLCKEILGKDNTVCLFMPDKTTPLEDIKHKDIVVKKLGLKCEQIEITSIVDHMRTSCLEKPDKLALANIKARIRMTLLFEYANMTKSLVCGTGIKSELLVGYFTKYGDGGVDIQPLGDLYKTQIYELAEYLKIPRELVTKPPTAGLWKGQIDEKELGMSYETLDKILYGLEHNLDNNEISKIVNVKKSDVERIRKMIIKSQHKRRTPLIPKIGTRTLGLDWRIPVQEG